MAQLTRRGKPSLNIRMDEQFMERLKDAIPSPHGKAGGVSLAIRELLHVVLDEPIPLQYGEKERDCPICDLESLALALEARTRDHSEAEDAINKARALIEEHSVDPVARYRLRAVIGRFYLVQG